MTTSDGGGARIGSASFALGLDLAQLTRDLDAAEALVRSRAQRIQGTISAIPVGGGGGSRGGFSPSPATPAAGAGTQRGGNAPAWAVTVYERNVAAGMTPQAARAALMRATGLRADELVGLGGSGNGSNGGASGRIPPPFSAPNGTPAPGVRASTGGRQAPIGGGGGLLAGTPQTALRFAGALFGVGLGLNVAVGAAQQLHRAMVDSVDAAIELAQRTRDVGVAFGSSAAQFTGAGGSAAAFQANPTTRGTQQQYLAAAAGLAPVAAQFGLTTQNVQGLVTIEGQLARLHGVELPQAGQVLEAVLRGNVDAGTALDLQLTDQYGRLKSVGLSFDELVRSIGRVRAEQVLLSSIQQDVNRQLQNSASQGNTAAQALDRLGKAQDNLRSRLGPAPGTVAAIANAAADAITPPVPTVTTPPSPLVGMLMQAGPLGVLLAPWIAQHTGQQMQQTTPWPVSGLPEGFANEQLAGELLARQAHVPTPGELRANRLAAATDQASRAGISATIAQSQVDTLGIQSDQRRLSVQGQINEIAQARLDIEGRLAPVLLEQQRIQDQVTLATRERLDLTQRTLQAQQAAVGPEGASAQLSYEQQRVRILAQIQQSRAIRGLGPAAGVPGIPELFGQARDLALAAPEVALPALDAQHAVDVATRAQNAARTTQQLSTIPSQQRLQQIQDLTIPLGQAESAAKAAADAIDRSLQGADIVAGPARIQAEKDLANARLLQADAVGRIARENLGTSPNINIPVTFTGNINDTREIERIANDAAEQLKATIIKSLNFIDPYNKRSSPGIGILPGISGW